MKQISYLALFLCMFTASIYGSTEPCLVTKKQTDTPVWITIFVHGAIKAEWIFNSLIKVLQDSVRGSTYQKAVSVARNDPFFFRFHAMQELGLKKIEVPKGETGLGASAVAHLYDQITAYAQQTPTINYYYTFGWSGLMSPTLRLQESQQFYNELVAEVKKIEKQHHVVPRIRLIGYSHGGNVCLNLAQAKKETHDACLCVDELVLMGSPVQRETDHLVADPMFKKVYNFHSSDDLVQPLDIVTSKSSNRVFRPHSNFELPSKLKQVNVKVIRYSPRQQHKHKDVMSLLPQHFEKTKIRKSSMNPGHIELWYMGWVPSMYRKNFPLHPLPVVEYVSFITSHIENDTNLKNNISVTIHPQREIMQIKSLNNRYKKTVGFIPTTMLAKLHEDAQIYKPDEAYYKEYNDRINATLTFARASKSGGLVRVQKPDGSFYKVTKSSMCLN